MQRYDTVTIKAQKTDEGFIRDKPIIGRAGLLKYINADGSTRIEYRPPEEAFNADSLASLKGKPITINHVAMVNAGNAPKLPIVGTVLSDGIQDGNDIRADISIYSLPTDARELSCGYNLNLDETPGITPDGQHYDALQKDIRYNHIAVVSKGRAGNARLNMDGDQVFNEDEYNDDSDLTTEQRKKLPKTVFGLPDKMAYPMPDKDHAANAKARAAQMLKAGNLTQQEYEQITKKADEILSRKDGVRMDKIRLDNGIEYDCSPEVKIAIEKYRADNAEQKKKIDTLQAKYDSSEATVKKAKEDAEKADKDRKEKFDAAVNARMGILKTADQYKLDKADEMTDKDIKIAVIKKVNGDALDLKDKSDEYINAAFDMCKATQHNDAAAAVRAKINGAAGQAEHNDDDDYDYIAAAEKMRQDEMNAWMGGTK